MVRHVVFGYDNDASKRGLQAVGDRWFDQQMSNGPPLRAHTLHNPTTNRKIDQQTNSVVYPLSYSTLLYSSRSRLLTPKMYKG